MSDRDKTDPGTVTERPEFTSQVVVDAAGLSHVGRVRTNNEDHFLISRLGRFMEVEHTNIPEDMQPERFEECFYGMIVADGVGGGAAGEVASRTAIRALVEMAATSPNWIFRLDDDKLVNELRARLRMRAGQIHDELIRAAKSDPSLKGFGTTMTIALSVGNVLFLSHIGDSRAYLLRQGVLEQLTHDHTLAQELKDKGFTSQEGVPVERFRHVLTQALTDRVGPVEPEVITIELEDKDRVLLCTDGLTDMVEDSAIAAMLAEPVPSAQVCRMLIEQALENGGTDNVTVALMSYRIGDSDTQY